MDSGPCYIYVASLYERHASHFKLGFTQNSARERSNTLPEKDSIDPNKCIAWQMMTKDLACSTERALHAMLRYLGYQRPRSHRHAGYTEWYAPEALDFVKNYMNNIKGAWFRLAPFAAGCPTQMRTILDGLRLALDEGAITMEMFDGDYFYTRIDAGASRVIEMLKGKHSISTHGDGELEVINCFEPLNGDESFYAALLHPRMPNHQPVNLEFIQLCDEIPSYSGEDRYFTFGVDEVALEDH